MERTITLLHERRPVDFEQRFAEDEVTVGASAAAVTMGALMPVSRRAADPVYDAPQLGHEKLHQNCDIPVSITRASFERGRNDLPEALSKKLVLSSGLSSSGLSGLAG